MVLSGSFHILFLYDVIEEIRLEELRTILKAPPARREPAFPHPAPEYVRFQKFPIIEFIVPSVLESGERFHGRMVCYEYGGEH